MDPGIQLESRPSPVTPLPSRVFNSLGRLVRGYWDLVVAFLLVLALWEGVVVVFDLPFYILPKPSAIAQQAVENRSFITEHFVITLREALIGYGIAIGIAIPLAVSITYSALLSRTLYPAVVFFDVLPKVALAPLLITWFGFGPEPPIVLCGVSCFFPILIEGVHGFKAVDPEVEHLARSTGAREWDTFWKIRVPNALPYLFVGLRYAAGAAMTGAITAEFLAGFEGLGFYLLTTFRRVRTGLGMAIIVTMAAIGMSMFFGIQLLERLVIPWHVSQRAVHTDR